MSRSLPRPPHLPPRPGDRRRSSSPREVLGAPLVTALAAWVAGACGPALEASGEVQGAIFDPAGPDLYVRTVRMPRAPQDFFDVAIEVCNRGPGDARGGFVALHGDTKPAQSVAEALAQPNLNGRFLAQSTLNAGHCGWTRVQLPPPSRETFVSVVLDPTDSINESDESNNLASPGSILKAQTDPYVAWVKVAPRASGDVDVQVKLCNDGFSASLTQPVRVYLSADEALEDVTHFKPPVQDHLLATMAPPAFLGASGCELLTQAVPAPAVGGAFFPFATIDEANVDPDDRRSNNRRIGERVGVNTPDLVVKRFSVQASSRGLDLDYEVCNLGSGGSGATSLLALASVDPVFDLSDQQVDVVSIPAIGPVGCTSGRTRVSRPRLNGRLHLGALVDPGQGVNEALRSNNTRSAGVSYFGSIYDLAAARVWAESTDANGLVIVAEICNPGTLNATAFSVDFYLTDTPGRIDGVPASVISGSILTSQSGGALAPGKCKVIKSAPVGSPLPRGVTTFPAVSIGPADAFPPNNWAAGAEMIPSNGPDLEILSVAVGGGQVSAMICNRGAGSSVEWPFLYESGDDDLIYFENTNLGPEDQSLGALTFPSLNPGQCAVASGPYTPSQPWVRTGVVVAADSNPLNDALLAPAP